MNASVGATSNALCVDLDGTLLRGDLFFESLFALVRVNPFMALFVPFWLLRGKAHLKRRLAERVTLDVAHLPYNRELLTLVRAERAKGRRVVLVTASDERLARGVADHLDVFDEVMASDGTVNLRAGTKAAALSERFTSFDYAGNSRDDVAVWDAARTAFVVGDAPAARAYARRTRSPHLPHPARSQAKVWTKTLRLHQWLKNALVFVPLVLSGHVFDLANWLTVGAAFLAFGLCASSVYVLNDLLDLEADRRHSTKRYRPIAAGMVSIPAACLGAAACLAGAVAVAAFLPLAFAGILTIYYTATLGYSLVLKRKMLVDVIALAGLFTLRVLAGAAALGVGTSAWLLGFCVFFFLSLALVKRYVELASQPVSADGKVAGRGYVPEDIDIVSQAGLASGFAAVVVLALFIDSPAMRGEYGHPTLVWLICPLVLYMIVRIWMLARRGQMNDDPVVFLMSDWRSLLLTVMGAALVLTAKLA